MRKRATFKQKLFARKYVEKKGNATQAALEAYDASYDDAQVIASQNLDKPIVIEEINKILKKSGLNDDSYIGNALVKTIDSGVGNKTTNSDALRALDMLLRIKNAYPNNVKKVMSLNLSGNSNTKSLDELTASVKQLNALTTSLVKEFSS